MSSDLASYIARCEYLADLQNRTRSNSQRQMYQILYNYSLESINNILHTQQQQPIVPVQQPKNDKSLREKLEAQGISIPEEYICPITMDIMTDPVILSDGHVYEKSAIERWFQTNTRSPLTNCVVDTKMIPCHAIRNLIQKFTSSAAKTEKKKRAPNPYNIFVKERFPVVKKNNPNLSSPDIIKLIAEEWKKRK